MQSLPVPFHISVLLLATFSYPPCSHTKCKGLCTFLSLYYANVVQAQLLFCTQGLSEGHCINEVCCWQEVILSFSAATLFKPSLGNLSPCLGTYPHLTGVIIILIDC